MKKLMVAMAVVAMAVSAQAVCCTWNFFTMVDIENPTGGGYYNGTAILSIAAFDWSYEVTVENGGFDFYVDIDSAEQQLVADYDVTLTATSGGWQLSGIGGGLTDDSYNGSCNIAEYEWNAVPEPTSGLLMLLGVAGLAPRRRNK